MSAPPMNSAEPEVDPNRATTNPKRAARANWILGIGQLLTLAAVFVALIASRIQREREFEQIRQIESQSKRLEAQIKQLEAQCERLEKQGRLPVRDEKGR